MVRNLIPDYNNQTCYICEQDYHWLVMRISANQITTSWLVMRSHETSWLVMRINANK